MLRKFAVALIATTMFVAPALAADAVNTKPASGAGAGTDSKTVSDSKTTKTSTPVSGTKASTDAKGAPASKSTGQTGPAATTSPKTVGTSKPAAKPAPVVKPATESKPLSEAKPVKTKPAKVVKTSRRHHRYAHHRLHRHYAHHRLHRHLQAFGNGANGGYLMAAPSKPTAKAFMARTTVKHVKVIKAKKHVKHLVRDKKTIVNKNAAS